MSLIKTCSFQTHCAKIRQILSKLWSYVVVIFIWLMHLHRGDWQHILPQTKALIYAIDIIQDYVTVHWNDYIWARADVFHLNANSYLRYSFAVDGIQSLPYGMRLKLAAQGKKKKRDMAIMSNNECLRKINQHNLCNTSVLNKGRPNMLCILFRYITAFGNVKLILQCILKD